MIIYVFIGLVLSAMTLAMRVHSPGSVALWADANGSFNCKRACQKVNALAVPGPLNDGGIFGAVYICAGTTLFTKTAGTVIKANLNPKFRCQIYYEVSSNGILRIDKKVESSFQCLCD